MIPQRFCRIFIVYVYIVYSSNLHSPLIQQDLHDHNFTSCTHRLHELLNKMEEHILPHLKHLLSFNFGLLDIYFSSLHAMRCTRLQLSFPFCSVLHQTSKLISASPSFTSSFLLHYSSPGCLWTTYSAFFLWLPSHCHHTIIISRFRSTWPIQFQRLLLSSLLILLTLVIFSNSSLHIFCGRLILRILLSHVNWKLSI